MAAINTYATLAEIKASLTASGQTLTTDAADDAVIEKLLESASRYIDEMTGERSFYPRVETRYYSIPESHGDTIWIDGVQRSSKNARELVVDDDLLEVISITNGDATSVTSAQYDLVPKNIYPKFAIRFKSSVSIVWEDDSSGNIEDVIAVTAIWGYHDRYAQRGWTSGGTLGAAITTNSALTFTMSSGHSLAVGQVVKIDNELFNVSGVSSNTITVPKRGDNGSTAATHLTSVTVNIWNPQHDIRELCLEMARNLYKSRFGENAEVVSTITAAGVVVTPRAPPSWGRDGLEKNKKVIV